ncbi:MAG: CHAT domain-containing protein, partial [Gemmatimonadota bacterium]|nr:CHAT domain-containing protein [Gemmatimonadota bacterium]
RALALARSWADSQVAAGNVEGAARAELSVASLLDGAHRLPEALDEAARAESLAVRANIADVRIAAATTQVSVLLALHRPREALAVARRVNGAELAGADDERRLDAEVAVGDALAANGADAEALARYDGAGRLVDEMADQLATDADRARLVAHRMAPFDHAVALLLRERPSAARTDALVRWAQRRTAAAFPDPIAHAADLDRPLPAPLSAASIALRLEPHAALVDYVLLDSAAAAIVIRRGETAIVPLPATRAVVDGLVAALRRLASTYGDEEDLSRSVVDTAAADSLSAILIAPLMPRLGGIERLAVIPDDGLYLLPFDLLPAGRSGTVLDRFAVSLVPAPTFLSAARGAPDAAPLPLLAVAGNAPGARREIASVRQAWTRGPVTVAAPSAVGSASLRRSLGEYAILHFATHAIDDATDPLGSRLLLGPSPAAGVLDVSDIESIRTHARLVVLSACETEGGPLVEGVGPMGLARAFLVSGSRAVIATEWPVGAPTADLMRVFYEKLATGAPADVALRAAKLSLRGSAANGQPFNWAGFVLIGDPDGVAAAR